MSSKKYVLVFFVLVLSPMLISAEIFQYEDSGDQVEIGESFEDVLPIISSSDLPALDSPDIITDRGTTRQYQYIHFGDALTSLTPPTVQYVKSDDSGIGSFIQIDGGTSSGEAYFEFEIVFDKGLESSISSSNNLEDLEDVKLKLFADEYTIIDTEIDTTTSEVKLLLATSSISDTVFEGDSKVYTIGTKKYEVLVDSITASPDTIRMNVNGLDIGQLEEDGYHQLSDDTVIGVRNIVTSDGAVKDLATIYLGAKTLELEDTYNDDTFEQGLSVNGEKVAEGFNLLKGSVSSDIFSLTNLKYRGTNPSKIYVGQGTKLSHVLYNEKSLIGNWDIIYNGFKPVSETQIGIVSDDSTLYDLTFENQNSKTYKIPFYHQGGSIGDGTKTTHIVESASSATFNIETGDYMILSTGSSKTDKTYAIQYNTIDTINNKIKFNEMLESGISEITSIYSTTEVSGGLGEGTVDLSGNQFRYYIKNETGYNISMDLDLDGSVESDSVDVIVNGGGILDLGNSNTPGTPYSLQMTTKASSFEESTSDETTTFQLTGGSNVGIPSASFTNIVMNGESDTYTGMSDYGAEFYLVTSVSGSNSGNLEINYPLEQRFADVQIELLQQSTESTTVGETQTSCSDGIQNGDETGLDCGGSCGPCELASCSNGIQDFDEEGVDCGGSCLAECTLELLGEELTTQETTQETTTQATTCPFGCDYSDSEGNNICMKVGESLDEAYCSAPQSLIAKKDNSESCSVDAECKSNLCSENVCGMQASPVSLVLNGILVLLIIFVFFKVHNLLKTK